MPAPELPPFHVLSLDPAIGRKIIDVHIWAVRQGLRGIGADELFDGFCQQLVIAGLPLWRAFAGMRTLHPQWGGYSYTWRRDLNAIEHDRFARGVENNPDWIESPFRFLVNQMRGSDEGVAWLRRRLEGPDAQLDFPVLTSFVADGATDYFAQFFRFGPEGDPSRGIGVAYSFATDQPDGFTDSDLALLRGVLPAASIAMMAKAAHTIARSLLEAYLGGDAGRRVHAGAIERGSVETIRAVLWFADVRGFTGIADAAPGPVLIELLDGVFETLTAALRPREGQVLKFLGDGMLAIFPFTSDTEDAACQQALDAATEAMAALAALNEARRAADKPTATVDLALHAGEVLYGNVGAVDRLDFTVIGPAVNEVARIEALCEPLGRSVLLSAEFAASMRDRSRLEPLGQHKLRGVREPREIFGLVEGAPS
ncbi:MAG TPA: adenylate/guanylate cyclase domain-containing protein [Xanthobacteraceae bacterium]|jgi:adenylate cyclase|nr:adenylate/guanylate cyclase domain-containing protein [Xanthobacteraceae bacterium]